MINQPIARVGDRERRHRDRWTIALALLGVPVASVAAYLSAQLIAHAWEACLVDLDAGGRFALFVLMCGMAALAWIGFVVGALATRATRSHLALRGRPRGGARYLRLGPARERAPWRRGRQ